MKSLKLNQIEKNVLSANEMNQVNGGGWLCSCSCYWAGNGGSSTSDNGGANAMIPGGGSSEQGDNKYYEVVCTP